MKFKKHLKSVVRKNSQENKLNYKVVLSQNERNYNIAEGLFKKFISSIEQRDLFFYPNTDSLIYKLSKFFKLQKYNIMLTPGSDIGIKTIFESFDVEENEVITSNFYFPMYEVYSKIYKTKLIKVNYSNLKFKPRNILSKINSKTKFIILANPNSPVGDKYSINDLKPILDSGVPVVIDEAYHEYTGEESFAKYINQYPNLIILKTFSKGLGAAGCRIGYILSNKDNINILSKLKFMYELSGISIKYAEFILDNFSSYKRYIENTMKEKNKLVKQLRNKGYNVIDSNCNWFFIKSSKIIKDLFRKNNILVKSNTIPNSTEEWIKFNYDLKVKKTEIVDNLLSNENIY